MGCAQWYGLQPCLPENKFSATMPTTHTALRADKTKQKVELRSSKNASLNKKPSSVTARTQLIMCCKTINNSFRNLSQINLAALNFLDSAKIQQANLCIRFSENAPP